MTAAVKDEAVAHRFARDHLKSFIERVERLEEEIKSLQDDRRDVYLEAKNTGFDVPALREIVRRRKMDVNERQERDAILDTYMMALGMIPGDGTSRHDVEPARPTRTQTTAALAQAMANDGLISQEAAAETARIGEAVDRLEDTAIARAVANPKVRAALKKLGTPVELTDEEKAKGCTAAFEKNGTRMTISAGPDRAQACAANDDTITTSVRSGDHLPGAAGCTPTPASNRADRSQRGSSSAPLSGSVQSTGAARIAEPGPFAGGAPGLRAIDPQHETSSIGGDRPQEAPSVGGQNPPPEADDPGELPPFLRRSPDNIAPFMRVPPKPTSGEPRAPPG